MQRIPSEQDRRQVLAAYEAGEPTKVIAHRFSVNSGYPSHLARACGVPLRRDRRRASEASLPPLVLNLNRSVRARLKAEATLTGTTERAIARQAIRDHLETPEELA